MKIIKKFHSRKNKVYLRDEKGNKYIEKIYSDAMLAKRAYEIYQEINESVACPKVIEAYGNTINMQYIEGDTLLDIFLRAQRDKIELTVDSLLICLENLYKANYIQTDNNFSNYIFNNGKCYAIDFDEMIKIANSGYTYNDCISDIILFALTYDFVDMEYKASFVKAITSKVNVSLDKYITRAKERYYIRRNRAFEQDLALQDILGYRQ